MVVAPVVVAYLVTFAISKRFGSSALRVEHLYMYVVRMKMNAVVCGSSTEPLKWTNVGLLFNRSIGDPMELSIN